MPRSKIFLILILSITFSQVTAQRFVSTNSFDRLSKVTFGVGMSTYFGELRRPADPGLKASLTFGLGYEHLITDNIALRTQLSLYTIKADDASATLAEQRERNLNFKATNTEFILQGMYYFFRHPAKGYRSRAVLNPFLHLGLGVTSNNPIQTLNGTEYQMRSLSIEGQQYGKIAFMVPIGFGFDILISKNFDLQFDVQYNYTFTGYLDDVSGVYRDQASFTDTDGVPAATMALLSDPRTALTPPVAPLPAGERRGNGTNDSYLRASVKLAYYLPKSLYGKSSMRCRVIKKTR